MIRVDPINFWLKTLRLCNIYHLLKRFSNVTSRWQSSISINLNLQARFRSHFYWGVRTDLIRKLNLWLLKTNSNLAQCHTWSIKMYLHMVHYYIFTNHDSLRNKLWYKVIINIKLFSLFSVIIKLVFLSFKSDNV